MMSAHTKTNASGLCFSRPFLLILISIVVSACATEEQTELKDWMKQQRSKTPASISPVTAPVAFIPTPYGQSASSDPFDEQKLKNVLAKIKTAINAGIAAPDVSRKREPLEGFPLDNIKMTGFVLKQGKPSALVSASGTLYSVSAGQYIGQDFGKIAGVSEQEITIKEVVQDASGVWAERTSKLPLMVTAKETKK
jgi:type IV pilus assembly protein PilP